MSDIETPRTNVSPPLPDAETDMPLTLPPDTRAAPSKMALKRIPQSAKSPHGKAAAALAAAKRRQLPGIASLFRPFEEEEEKWTALEHLVYGEAYVVHNEEKDPDVLEEIVAILTHLESGDPKEYWTRTLTKSPWLSYVVLQVKANVFIAVSLFALIACSKPSPTTTPEDVAPGFKKRVATPSYLLRPDSWTVRVPISLKAVSTFFKDGDVNFEANKKTATKRHSTAFEEKLKEAGDAFLMRTPAPGENPFQKKRNRQIRDDDAEPVSEAEQLRAQVKQLRAQLQTAHEIVGAQTMHIAKLGGYLEEVHAKLPRTDLWVPTRE